MRRSMWGGAILTLGLVLVAASAAQAGGNGSCGCCTAQTAPAPGTSVAQAAPQARSYSYQAPTTAAPQRTMRSYSYNPGYTNRGYSNSWPQQPYQQSPRYLHADAKARGWNFRYSPNTTN